MIWPCREMPADHGQNGQLKCMTRTHSLSDIVDDDCAVRVTVVHWCQALVSLLSCGIPDLELDSRIVIEGDSLSEEGSADRGFSVVIELILIIASINGAT